MPGRGGRALRGGRCRQPRADRRRGLGRPAAAAGAPAARAAGRQGGATGTTRTTEPAGTSSAGAAASARRALTANDITAIRGTVSRELNDIDKNMLRTGEGLRRSLALLDDLWTQLAGHATGTADRDGLRARETVALVAAGRWVLNSAIAREESRGMHQRTDAPDRDPWFTRRVTTSGLDTVLTTLAPASQQRPSEQPAAERVAS
jgi:succinate dehydrogenase/fumarate reductase flavoprotein subunit